MRHLLICTALSAFAFVLMADVAQARGGRRSCGGSSCNTGCYTPSNCGSCATQPSCGSCYTASSCGSCYAPSAPTCSSCVGSAPVISGSSCPTCVGAVMPSAPVATVAAEAPATLIVSLPANATLSVDGHATRSTSEVRTFATPSLATSQDFTYTLTAQIEVNGKSTSVEKQVVVRGGETTRVTLKFPGTDVASK